MPIPPRDQVRLTANSAPCYLFPMNVPVSAREIDRNGFVTIERNPISRIGVFPYSGRSLPGADPERIYFVYRPPEELSHPDCIESFKLMPIIDEHPPILLGMDMPAEEKGTHGTSGEEVVYEDGKLFAKLRMFSETLKRLIASGKRQLSAGYRCRYEKKSGVFEGQAYDYIQRDIRGNHIALVPAGRMGAEIAVLDHFAFDHFDLALETEETGTTMADEPNKEIEAEEKKAEGAEEEKEMTLTEVSAMLKKLLPQVKELADAVKAANVEEDLENVALDENADKDEKKEGMDAAEIGKLSARLAAVESRDTKALLKDVAARDALARDVSKVVGTFDHAEMTADEVAAYALDHLEIKAPKGQERAVLAGYMAGLAKAQPVSFALDHQIKTGGKLDARLNAKQA